MRWPTFAPVAGETPVGWQIRTVPGATSCPTARQGRSGRASWVVPSTLLDADVKKHVGSTGRAVRRSLETSERYLLGAQYDAKWKATRKRAYLDLIAGSHDELDIRLPAMSALTVAIGLRTGAYDRAVVGRSRTSALRYVDQLVRSIACSHLSVSPGGWGRGWETAHWAMLAGAAAWLVWDDLTPETQADVASMVVDEADRLTHQSVGYWALANGTVLTPGDTKAEEDGWNSSLLSFADAMMPDAPHAAAWRAMSAELAVAAFSVRADDTSSSVVNGVRLSSRLQGYNAYPNGTVENHQRIHPDYASNIQLLWTSADFDRLAHRRVPEAMFHNAGLVYSAFSKVSYTAGATEPGRRDLRRAGRHGLHPGAQLDLLPPGRRLGHRPARALREPRRARHDVRGVPPGEGLGLRPGSALARARAAEPGGEQRHDRRPHLLGRPGRRGQAGHLPGPGGVRRAEPRDRVARAVHRPDRRPEARPWHAAGAGRHLQGAEGARDAAAGTLTGATALVDGADPREALR